jgi:diadenosine tetraphosphate (Ap4A) HIT family hydrolase
VLDWREDRIGSAHRGGNPMVMARLSSGFAVIGDSQHLPGYSLLLCENPDANHLSDLDHDSRARFLADMALLGEAVENACRESGLRRINYEVLGNSHEWLHAHVHAHYDWEPPERIGRPVWCYPAAEREAAEHAYDDARDGPLRGAITRELLRLAG